MAFEQRREGAAVGQAGQIVDLWIAFRPRQAAAQRFCLILAAAHLVLGLARAFQHRLGEVGEAGHDLARLLQLRSEEHTSELQSLMRISYAVFCLKKKTKIQHTYNYTE